ncbi:MAG: hypothetical protein N3D16_05130 [Anaerolineales bacterium]|nr:hypothetical protein [Anaerolineales bacterium]
MKVRTILYNEIQTDDAVDEIIEAVLAHRGQVTFLENGLLSEHQRIALILRYS